MTELSFSNPMETLVEQFFASARHSVWIRAEVPQATAQPDHVRDHETRFAAGVFQDQDPTAMQIIYDRYYERILNYLYRRTGDRELAEDLTSQTFLKAFKALHSESRTVWVRPWLYRTATNVHLSHARSFTALRKRIAGIAHQWISREALQVRADTLVSDRQEHIRLRKCLESMPEKYRAVLLLRFDEELAHAEIALSLGLSSATVRKRLERALQKLKQLFEEVSSKGTSYE